MNTLKEQLQEMLNKHNNQTFGEYEIKNGDLYWDGEKLDLNSMDESELLENIESVKNYFE